MTEHIEVEFKEGADLDKIQKHLLKNQFIKKIYMVTTRTLRIYYDTKLQPKILIKMAGEAEGGHRNRKQNIQHIKAA